MSRAEFDLAMSFATSQLGEQAHRLASLKPEIQRQKSNAASAQADAARARETLPLVAERAEMSRKMVEGGVIFQDGVSARAGGAGRPQVRPRFRKRQGQVGQGRHRLARAVAPAGRRRIRA